MTTMIEELSLLFAGPGAAEYLGEPVTIGVHMRQAAALAEAAGAPGALVAAALLHDIGHLRAPRGASPLEGTVDARHGDQGANWLSAWFGPEVTEPVRLHVAAKRYLCATEPDYYAALSEESKRTLEVQGGPLDADGVRRFEQGKYAKDAVAVRRWDDQAKEPAVTPPEFGHFAPLLNQLLGWQQTAGPSPENGGTGR
jgi:gamma-butyrobetaine dioxygenase